MTPREFLSVYEYDKRIIRGTYFPSTPLDVEKGDTVGVVLMNLGGPNVLDDVEPFLYNLFMDPGIIDIPIGGIFRHWLCKVVSKLRAKSVREDYEMIGGGSPINRLTREQSKALREHLNRHYGQAAGVNFKTYIAMRYWKPFSEDAVAQMKEDGVDKVVLLPLYPHYSKTTTGSSIVYWKALEEEGSLPELPTTTVFEYATNPKYIRALSERIDEGLQRFSDEEREEVHLLFSAHGTPIREMRERRDPYCCLVHSTVNQLMHYREHDYPFHTAFQSKVGPAEWLSPSTPDKLEELAEEKGVKNVLVIPVAFVTDHVETSFELDIEVREEAEEFGIERYEVTSGLNSHPLFIEALAESTMSQLDYPVDVNTLRHGGDGAPTGQYPLRPLDELPRYSQEERDVRCPNCECITEARCWTDNIKEAVGTVEPANEQSAAEKKNA